GGVIPPCCWPFSSTGTPALDFCVVRPSALRFFFSATTGTKVVIRFVSVADAVWHFSEGSEVVFSDFFLLIFLQALACVCILRLFFLEKEGKGVGGRGERCWPFSCAGTPALFFFVVRPSALRFFFSATTGTKVVIRFVSVADAVWHFSEGSEVVFPIFFS
ncbi:unnamed protein product, partial [Pylaiella littoralis]